MEQWNNGAKSLSRNWKIVTCVRISPHFTEPEGALPYSQNPLLVPILRKINPIYDVMFYCLENEFHEIWPSEILTLSWGENEYSLML